MIYLNFKKKISLSYYDFICGWKAKNTYPENLKNGLDGILENARKIKVAVIDDVEFPFQNMIENDNCILKRYSKYTKDIHQNGQRLKAINLGSPDIILCAIHGVGEELYHDYAGLGVMEHLRKKHPFSAIIAYTGNPGFVTAKIRNSKVIDGIFAKEWGDDDFYFNFNKVKDKFLCPSQRWIFIRERLLYLDASEKKIDELRYAYVKHALLTKMLNEKIGFNSTEIFKLISENKDVDFDSKYWAKIGIRGLDMYGIFSPLIGA